jgi:uncharacterized membrane protein
MDKITAQNVKTVTALDQEHDDTLSLPEKIANKITDFAGSIPFLVWHAVIFAVWIIGNQVLGGFDKYPFPLLATVAQLESIFLTGLVLIGQNISSAKQDRRHKLALQINLLAEQENTAMLRVLERIALKVGVDTVELKPYLSDTQPGEVLKALEVEEKEIQEAKAAALKAGP